MKQDIQKHLAELFCTPLAISYTYLAKVEAITSEGFASNGVELALPSWKKKSAAEMGYDPETRLGVVNVEGLLLDKYDAEMDYYYGITAYESILQDVGTFLEAGATRIVLMADSGGGQARGMMESSVSLRDMVDAYGAELITYVDGTSASAMYGISAVSHKIIANPEAEVGSIGVIVSLTDMSKYLENLGISYEFITAGEGKSARNPDGSFTQAFKDSLQVSVDATYERFTNHVSTYRPVTKDQLKAFGASVFSAKDALDKGLVDAEMNREQFFTHLADLIEKDKNMNLSMFNKKPKATQLSKEAEMPNQNVELQAALAAATADFTAKLEAKDKATAASLASMQAELESAKAALSAVAKEKEDAKQATRLAKLTDVYGTEKAAQLAASFAALDDASFDLTVGILASREVENEKNLQTETGSEGAVVVEGEESLSLEDLRKQNAERLKAKHSKKSK